MKQILLAVVGMLVMSQPLAGAAQYGDFSYGIYALYSNTIAITAYTGTGGDVVIPGEIAGVPVTTVQGGAFSRCPGLTSVTLPGSISNVAWAAFQYCSNFTTFVVDATNATYSSLDGVLCSKNQDTLIEFPCGRAGTYTLPSSIRTVRQNAFTGSIGITNLIIPSTMTSLLDSALWGCDSLISITVDPDNPSYSSLDGVFFNKNRTTLIQYPSGRTGRYTVPSGVTTVYGRAFYFVGGLTSVTIPASVTLMLDWAFMGCTNLQGVYFEAGPPGAAYGVFEGADRATLYYLPGTVWDPTFAGRPTALWNPLIQRDDPSFGVQTSGFGFSITGTTNIPLVIEACADLANAAWTLLQTTNIPGDGSIYFNDPNWTNYSARYYRLRPP